jgi:ketosteroid isomerase-like protein
MSAVTHNLELIRDILDRMQAGDVRPLGERLAPDAAFSVAGPDGCLSPHLGDGKQAALDYFAALGDIMTFWRVRYSGGGERVIVLGEERFTTQPAGLEADAEFALLFDIRGGLITQLVVIEDLLGPGEGGEGGAGITLSEANGP